MSVRLISAPSCPFVQRAVIALREKGIDFDVDYIDLGNKPRWFLEISPRGKVPVLVVDGTPVFESQAIIELLEDLYPVPALRPRDLIQRAQDRAWFAVASEDLLMPQWQAISARDEATFRAAIDRIETTLRRIEGQLHGRDWLSGDGRRFGGADLAVAPFFSRLEELRPAWELPADLPAVRAWADRILARPSVRDSVPEAAYREELERWTEGTWVRSLRGAAA